MAASSPPVAIGWSPSLCCWLWQDSPSAPSSACSAGVISPPRGHHPHPAVLAASNQHGGDNNNNINTAGDHMSSLHPSLVAGIHEDLSPWRGLVIHASAMAFAAGLS
eukprot:jgi/Chlat1/5405/Chrsp35S05308